MTIRENKDYNRVPLHSYYTTLTGWGVLLFCGLGRLTGE